MSTPFLILIVFAVFLFFGNNFYNLFFALKNKNNNLTLKNLLILDEIKKFAPNKNDKFVVLNKVSASFPLITYLKRDWGFKFNTPLSINQKNSEIFNFENEREIFDKKMKLIFINRSWVEEDPVEKKCDFVDIKKYIANPLLIKQFFTQYILVKTIKFKKINWLDDYLNFENSASIEEIDIYVRKY